MPDDLSQPEFEVAPAVTHRSFDDVDKTRSDIFDNVLTAYQKKFPISNDRYTLKLDNLHYRGAKPFGPADQKKAIMRGRTLGHQLVGSWQLVDNKTQQVVDRTKPQMVAQVPYMTNRGTFIFNGSEYTISGQMRLRPGVYSRVKDNGLVEAHFNVKGGTGPSFRVHMEPDSGVFRMHVGQANLKLYPIMRALGVTDKELQQAWGRDLLAANVAASDPRAAQRAYAKLVRSHDTGEQMAKEAFGKEMKASVNYVQLGTYQQCAQCKNFNGTNECTKVQGFISPTGWCVLWVPYTKWASVKEAQDTVEGNRRRVKFLGELVCDDSNPEKPWAYLKVHRGLPEAAHQALVDQGVDCEPQFELPHISVLRNWEAKQLIEKYGKKWKAACGNGRKFPFSLQNAMVDLNPEGWDDMDRVWFLEAKSPELRAHRKSLGFEDLPRGDDTGKEFQFHITVAVKPAKDSRGASKIAAMFDNVEELTKQAFDKFSVEIMKSVTPVNDGLTDDLPFDLEDRTEKLAVIIEAGDPSDLDQEDPMDLEGVEAQAANDIKGNPGAVASKLRMDKAVAESRAVRLAQDAAKRPSAEVQQRIATKHDEDTVKRAFVELVGREALMVKRANDQDYSAMHGVLSKMELDENTTEQTLGRRVRSVSPQLITDVTRRLIAINRKEQETDDRDSLAFQQLLGPEELFAERVDRDAGDIARRALWKSTFRGNLKNMVPGVMSPQLRSLISKSGLAQTLEEINPLEVHDQLLKVTRMGEGGMTSADSVPDECFDDQTQVFTRHGWVDWTAVTPDTEFACILNGALSYCKAKRLIAKPFKGKLYGVRTRTLDLLVTPNHRMWVRKYRSTSDITRLGHASWEFELASAGYCKPRQFLIAHGAYAGREQQEYVLSAVSGARRTYRFKLNDWAELVGWYLSEGSIDQYSLKHRSKYHITISQIDASEHTSKIADLLTRMGIAFSRQGHNFVFVSKQIGVALAALGHHAYDKRLPEESFEWPVSARAALFKALISGDGSTRDNGGCVYHSTSYDLCHDVCRLATTIGYAAKLRKPRVHDNPAHRVCYSCGILSSQLQGVTSERQYAKSYYKQAYDGMVYCAEVPGERLLVRRNGSVPVWTGNSRNVQPSHFSFIDPVRAPEGTKVGVDSRVTHGAMKGSDGNFYSEVIDPRTGQRQMMSAVQLSRSIVAFPGEMEKQTGRVRAMLNGKTVAYVDRKQVNFVLPSANRMFTITSNLVPMISAIKGGRLLMGAKMATQALPLQDGETPLVQNAYDDGSDRSFENVYGEKMGAVRAQQAGVVQSISKDGITVKQADGVTKTYDLYHNFPYNRKTYLHNTAAVKVGDQVAAGGLLAKSNYTDNSGDVALGKNLRVGYMTYKGFNADDAIVISEAAAKKLSSEHMYTTKFRIEDNHEVGKKQFMSMYPGKFNKEQMATIDDNGLVRPGTVLKYGDPLVLAISKRKSSGRGVLKGRKTLFSDSAEVWDHESPGVVTDVDRMRGGWKVLTRAYSPMQIGDKLANRYGGKGVVSRIIADDQMPHDKDGQPLELMLNPLGVVSRGNPAQLIETMLGKVAKKRGQPFKVPNFTDEAYIDIAKRELQKAGLSDTEDLYDPTTGRKIPKVFTGSTYMMKLHHMAEKKSSGRAVGAYTAEGLPAKGGEEGSKSVGGGELNALISHGATNVIRDAQVVRGQRNDDYWRAVRLGLPPPSPKVPVVYDKFLGMLQASGINLKKKGDVTQLFALTDKDVDELSSGPLTAAATVKGHGVMDPIKDGLFDVGKTGGHGGNRWAHIELASPMPNPVMEEPIRHMLGLTKKKFEGVIAGKEKIETGTGTEAILRALKKINMSSSIKLAEDTIKEGTGAKRDAAIKLLGYLRTLDKSGIKPEQLMVTKVPVLPPNFRPIAASSSTGDIISDANYLYTDLMRANEDYVGLRKELGDDHAGDERLQLYNGFKAVTGLGDPIAAKSQEKGVKGLLKQVFGDKPKIGMFQRRVLGAAVDTVGRGVITPNPSLNMDQVGLPEKKAWVIYRPHIMRQLVRRGMGAMAAAKAIADQSDVARKALIDVMGDRPVIISRAPALHRYSMMAFWPVLAKGDTLQIPPIVTPGFNADFDGDTMNYHVPATDEAVQDSINKMMPSRNLRAVKDFDVHYFPRQEFLLGLHLASTAKKTKNLKTFRSKADVLAAYKRGEVGVDDNIEILR